MKTYLEFKNNKSHRFWQIEVKDTAYVVTYGKIGSKGQQREKTFLSVEQTKTAYQKAIDEKLKKGYEKNLANHAKKKATNENPVKDKPVKESTTIKKIAWSSIKLLNLSSAYDTKTINHLCKTFHKYFGWKLPDEFIPWLCVDFHTLADVNWLFDDFTFQDFMQHLDTHLSMQFFQESDRLDVLMLGLFKTGKDMNGDAIYIDAQARHNNYLMSYKFNNSERDPFTEPQPFSAFVLKHKESALKYMEYELEHIGDIRSKEVLDDWGIESHTDLEKKLTKISQHIDKISLIGPPNTASHTHLLNMRFHRIAWLKNLLCGQKDSQLIHKVVRSPDFGVWESEKSNVADDSYLAYYWLFAHYFFGNENECREIIEMLNGSFGLIANALADSVKKSLDTGYKSGLGTLNEKSIRSISKELFPYIKKTHVPKNKDKVAKLRKKKFRDFSAKSYHKAIDQGDVSRVVGFVDLGMGIDTEYDDVAPYIVAARSGQIDVLKYLQKNSSKVNLEVAMHCAISANQTHMVEYLLSQGIAVNPKKNEQSLLSYAVQNWCFGIIDLLLEKGADPNIDKKEYSVLHLAINYIDPQETISKLITAGININAKDEFGRTALHIAAYDRKLNVMRFLVKHGAHLNARDNEGKTPLMVAAGNYYKRQEKAVNLLIELGANTKLVCKQGKTAYDWAMYSRYKPNILPFLEDQERKLSLIESLYSEAVMNKQETPLSAAIKFNYTRRFDEIIHNRSGLKQVIGENKTTPLCLAVEENNVYFVQKLLEAGVNCEKGKVEKNWKSPTIRWSPLAVAVSEGFETLVDLLLKHGANVNHCLHKGGYSIIMLAMQNKQDNKFSIIKKLVLAGANLHYKSTQGEEQSSALESAEKTALLDPEVLEAMRST